MKIVTFIKINKKFRLTYTERTFQTQLPFCFLEHANLCDIVKILDYPARQ